MKYTLDYGAYPPERAHLLDAGIDLRTPVPVTVPAKGYAIIHTGVHIEIPAGFVGFLKSKSGLMVYKNIISDGVIDAGYTGEIVAKLFNHGFTDVQFDAGDKVTQLVVLPCILAELEPVDKLSDTERGSNGFGSTGK